MGWEDSYEVSRDAVVRSVRRQVGGPHGLRWMRSRVLTQHVNSAGYRVVTLSREGKYAKQTVHRIVADAFLGEPPGEVAASRGAWQVNHIDGDKLNNVPSNLVWVTREQNQLHAEREGLRSKSRLTGDDWEKMQEMRENGASYAEIGRAFGYARGAVWNLFNMPARRQFVKMDEAPHSVEQGAS